MVHKPPRLRPIDVIAVNANGEPMALLRDRLDPIALPLALSQEGLLLLGLIDGKRTVPALRQAFTLRTGLPLSDAQVETFLEQLDQACLIDGERAEQKLTALREAFQEAAERLPIHAGRAYPSDPLELEAFLERCYAAPDGPGDPPDPQRTRRLAGLIAPHVDLHRGGPTYAWAASALKQTVPADLYVVLGTCHTPMQAPFAATRKPYATPLGCARIAEPALDWLAERCSWDLFADEFSHRAEHSIEFQALYLRHGLGDVAMLPLLCNSLHELVPPGASPLEAPPVAQLVDALRELASGRFGSVCFVAGADLAHVGPQFGDREPISAAFLARVARDDQEMLRQVCVGDAQAFYRQVTADQDARRICGLTPIFVFLAVLAGKQGELCKYTQWADPSGNSSVSFAVVAFPDELTVDSSGRVDS